MKKNTNRTPYFDKLLRNTPFGLFVGAVLSLLLVWALGATSDDDLKKVAGSIFSTVGTLFGAGLALTGVFSNIENQQNINLDNRARKLNAAKAFLPETLSRVCELCIKGIHYSRRYDVLLDDLGRDEFARVSISDLTLSDEVISVLKDVVELSDDNTVTDRVAGMLREHQVFLSRWTGSLADSTHGGIVHIRNVNRETTYWAYLHAISESLFDYARSEAESVETVVKEKEILRALRRAGFVGLEVTNFEQAAGEFARAFRRQYLD